MAPGGRPNMNPMTMNETVGSGEERHQRGAERGGQAASHDDEVRASEAIGRVAAERRGHEADHDADAHRECRIGHRGALSGEIGRQESAEDEEAGVEEAPGQPDADAQGDLTAAEPSGTRGRGRGPGADGGVAVQEHLDQQGQRRGGHAAVDGEAPRVGGGKRRQERHGQRHPDREARQHEAHRRRDLPPAEPVRHHLGEPDVQQDTADSDHDAPRRREREVRALGGDESAHQHQGEAAARDVPAPEALTEEATGQRHHATGQQEEPEQQAVLEIRQAQVVDHEGPDGRQGLVHQSHGRAADDDDGEHRPPVFKHRVKRIAGSGPGSTKAGWLACRAIIPPRGTHGTGRSYAHTEDRGRTATRRAAGLAAQRARRGRHARGGLSVVAQVDGIGRGILRLGQWMRPRAGQPLRDVPLGADGPLGPRRVRRDRGPWLDRADTAQLDARVRHGGRRSGRLGVPDVAVRVRRRRDLRLVPRPRARSWSRSSPSS